ncbi:hypothetical protein BT96DRAFT_655471 [Gymnopus androsaceus JB14]|uniref:Uncharacterized protein n=1 Tax=Gymnopus androsaceus JB14 TaxID=1447944 RepID=A0A6A4HR60_9AGAR|nr:hypothetical protein BT96DRAFT_655471 [Gymnopus androsaceus JB14]
MACSPHTVCELGSAWSDVFTNAQSLWIYGFITLICICINLLSSMSNKYDGPRDRIKPFHLTLRPTSLWNGPKSTEGIPWMLREHIEKHIDRTFNKAPFHSFRRLLEKLTSWAIRSPWFVVYRFKL